MSKNFDQRWASERLLDFALTFDAASEEMQELRRSKVAAQRIFNLYPPDITRWLGPMREAISNEAVAKAIWLEGNTFDSYRHILRHLAENDEQARGLTVKWNALLRQKGDSVAVTNAAWNVAIFLTALDRLTTTDNWLDLRRNETLMRGMGDFEDVMARVLQRAAAAR